MGIWGYHAQGVSDLTSSADTPSLLSNGMRLPKSVSNGRTPPALLLPIRMRLRCQPHCLPFAAAAAALAFLFRDGRGRERWRRKKHRPGHSTAAEKQRDDPPTSLWAGAISARRGLFLSDCGQQSPRTTAPGTGAEVSQGRAGLGNLPGWKPMERSKSILRFHSHGTSILLRRPGLLCTPSPLNE